MNLFARILLSVFLCFIAYIPHDAHSYNDKPIAVLRVMNKAAGKTYTVESPVGSPVRFEKLSIMTRACKQSDPFDAENFYAFVEITKSDGEQIFGNWMNRNSPGNIPLQNPDYDVWLVECK